MKKVLVIVLTLCMALTVFPAMAFADDEVAQIGETKYATLAAAINGAVENDVIKLIGNITLTETVTVNKSVTITGAGFSITVPDNVAIGQMVASAFEITADNVTFDGINICLNNPGTNFHGTAVNVKANNFTFKNGSINGKDYDVEKHNATNGFNTCVGILLQESKSGATIINNTIVGCEYPMQLTAFSGPVEFTNNSVEHSIYFSCNCANVTVAGISKSDNPTAPGGENEVRIVLQGSAVEDSMATKLYKDSKLPVYKTTEWGSYGEGDYTPYFIAAIGENAYKTLAEAIGAVGDSETIVMIADETNAQGISVSSGKNFTVDFNNHVYTVNKPGAGSTNTKTQAFQLLKDSTVTFKNGTIQCAAGNENCTWTSDATEKGIAMIIQNYCNLTLDNMVIDGTNIAHNGSNVRYVISNNCGNVYIKNNSVINAYEGDFAFDSCKYGSYSSPVVNVEDSVINGKVEASGGDINLKSGTVLNRQLRVGENKNGGATGSAVTIENGAKVNNSGGYAVVVFGNNTLNVEGEVCGIIGTNGNNYNAGSIININSGASVENTDDVAMYIPNGELNISGGTISGKTAVYFKSTKLNITGGELIGNGEQADYEFNANGCNPTGDSLVVDNCNYPSGLLHENVSISGGKFVSSNADAIGSYNGNGQNTKLSGFVSGGTFSSNPKDLVVEGKNIYKKSSPEEYVVGTTAPAHSAGMNTWTPGDDGYYVESYVAPPAPTGGSGSSEKSIVSAKDEEVVVAPKASAKDGEAQVEITEKNMDKAIALAEKNESESIVLEPVVSNEATKVEVDIPVEAAKNVVEKTDATLVVKAETAFLSIPNETLAEIVEAAEGEDIEINIAKADEKAFKEEIAELDDDEPVLAVEVTIVSGGKTISSFGGKALEVHVPVDAKKFKDGQAYTAYVFSADGSVEKTTAVIVNNEAVVVMSHFSTLVLTEARGTVFEDAEGQWYEDMANYCYANGLFIGDENKHFNGDYIMSEAELCTVLYRIANGSEPDPAEGDEWYSTAAKWAKDNKIDETFVAEGKLARGTFIKMFYDTLKLTGKYNTKVTSSMRSALKKNAVDYDEISSSDLDAVAWSVNVKLIIGYDPNELVIQPTGEITRAEVATMLMRYYQGL